ncbi:MAG: aminotransferase class I/II-fold pyridoxal phosphate-dependent enzyme, partial [Candidatus Zixiibacteriota bacterium]
KQRVSSEVLVREQEDLKKEIAVWFEKKYQFKLNPLTEILIVSGKKEAITGLTLSFLNPGELTIIPDPSEPIYRNTTILAGGESEIVPLLERNDYLPNLGVLSDKTLNQAKLLFLNYPHNPTSAISDYQFFKEVVEKAAKYNILVINDASYNHISYESTGLSLLQVKDAKKIGLEFHYFPSVYHIPGFRMGFLVGNREILSALKAEQETFTSGINSFSMEIAKISLKNYSFVWKQINSEFLKRRDIVLENLDQIGWKLKKPKASPFIWVKVPPKYSSLGFTRTLLRKTGVLVLSGTEFGENGEGWIRLALNSPVSQLKEAVERIKKHSHLWQRSYRPKRRKNGND